MEQVIRQESIEDLETVIAEAPLVTVSAPAAGGGVTTALRQWSRSARRPVEFATCPGFSPQRPLSAFAFAAGDVAALVRAGDWAAAARRLMDRLDVTGESAVVSIDDADRLDEASARLAAALLEAGGRVVLGHHHAPSTNPSLGALIEGVQPGDRASLVIPPMTGVDVEAALDEVDVDDALSSTGGNPLALSLYRGPGFASIATAVLERFDRLPADGQGLIAVLAASPEPIPFGLLEAMGRPWAEHGSQVDTSGLVAVDAGAISIRHDKVRRVLYEEMTAVRRRFVHAEILGTLGSGDLSAVMLHAVGAGDVETIIDTGPRAAAEAAALGANREAARHLENVLAYEHSIDEPDRSTIRASLHEYLAANDQTV